MKKGPGLGLAICKNLTEIMGGEISLESQLKVGTEFRVAIPVHSNEIREELIAEKIAAEDTFEIEAKNENTVLIAEDNAINQMLIQEQLKKKGFESILLAKNGREAVEQTFKHHPDLILMDIQMPEMDGNEAIMQLRERKFKKPIIAVSAYGIREEINRSLEIGANDYITKPIDFNNFFPKINDYLKVKKGKKPAISTPPKKQAPEKIISRPSYKVKGVVSESVFEIFMSDAHDKIKIMEEALDHFNKQKDKIAAIAHEYKGNASYFGLDILEKQAKEVDMGFKNKLPVKDLKIMSKQLLKLVKTIVSDNLQQ